MQSYFGPAALLSLLLAGLRMDREVFERVAREPRATHHCLAMSVLGAIGQAAYVAPRTGDPLSAVVVIAMLIALAGLVGRTCVVWLVGRLGLATERVGFAATLRPLGLAGAPGILFLAAAFADAAGPQGRWLSDSVLDPAIGLWLFVALVVAVRTALHRGWWLAILIAVAFRVIERDVDIFVAAP